MSNKAVSILLGCFLLLLLQSCRPKDVLSREDMGNVLFDIHLAEALLKPSNNENIDRWSNGLDRESFVDMTYRSVLKKHGLTPEQFDMNIRWYSSHLNRFDKVYKDVVDRLAEYKSETQKRLDLLRKSGASSGNSKLVETLWKTKPASMKAVFKPVCQFFPDSVLKYNQMQFGFRLAKAKSAFKLVPNATIHTSYQPTDSVDTTAVQIQEEVVEVKTVRVDLNEKDEGPHFVDFKPESRASRIKKQSNKDPKISERFRSRIEAAKKEKESQSK